MIKNIAFTADSGVLKQMDKVVIIPSCVQDGKYNSYLDQKTITNEEIYRRRNNGEKFKTSSPILGDFIDTFENQLENHDEVIHFSMSSGISAGSVNAAVQAANIVNPKRIHVLDTKQGGPGGSLVVEIALRLLEQGFATQDILDVLNEEILPNVKTTFLVPNPLGFLESGRNQTNGKLAPIWKEFLVKMLVRRGTEFEVVLQDGKLIQDKMHHYPKEAMYEKFIENHISNEELDYELLVYGGTLPKEERMESLDKFLLYKFPQYEKVRHDMGGVISAYACPDTFGISYVKKRG